MKETQTSTHCQALNQLPFRSKTSHDHTLRGSTCILFPPQSCVDEVGLLHTIRRRTRRENLSKCCLVSLLCRACILFFQNSRDFFLQRYLYRFLFAGIHVRPYNDDRVTRFAMLAAQWCLRQTRTPLCDSSGCSRDWPNEGPAKAISIVNMNEKGGSVPGLSPVPPYAGTAGLTPAPSHEYPFARARG